MPWHVCESQRTTAQESLLSFGLWGPGDKIMMILIRFGDKQLYPLNQLSNPRFVFFFNSSILRMSHLLAYRVSKKNCHHMCFAFKIFLIIIVFLSFFLFFLLISWVTVYFSTSFSLCISPLNTDY